MRVLLALALLTGCGVIDDLIDPPDAEEPPELEEPTPFDQGPPIAARGDLRMKRWRQLSLDLQGALELPADELCQETGRFDCADLHAVPLGGLSVDNGLFEPLDEPSATTGLATERFVLQACWHRFQRDQEGEPIVFLGIDPDGTALDPAAGAAQVTGLYRRLLARDPLKAESDALLALHPALVAAGGLNGEWQILACFSIATTSEALLF